MGEKILQRNDSASEEKESWGFSKEAWLPGEHVYKKVLGEGKAISSAAGAGDAGNLRARLRVPARAHGPEARTRGGRGCPRVPAWVPLSGYGRSRCSPAAPQPRRTRPGKGHHAWPVRVTEGRADDSLHEKEPRARGSRLSHLHQAPVGSRAAARETACSPRSGDPVRVASPAGSNWLPPWRSGSPARESIKLLLKGPRFAPGTEGGKRRGSHPRGLCGAQSLLGSVVSLRKLTRVTSWEV